MPLRKPEEIKKLIDDGEILAITIDTTIFDKFGCNLEYKSLTAVEQFKGKHIDFLLTPVTVGEVLAHITKNISDSAAKATAGINQFLKSIRSAEQLEQVVGAVGLRLDPRTQAKDMVDTYVDRVGAQITCQQATSDELLSLYFNVQAPFGKSAEKKAEFPDAIALLALEKWAREHDTLILVVSNDGDWQSFAEKSAELICINDLTSALSLFNDQKSVVAARVASAIKSGQATSLESTIRSSLETYVEDFYVEASSSYYYDYENVGSVLLDWSFDNEDSIVVVASDDEEVTLSFEIVVSAEFEADFTFSQRDSIDRDYITIGSANESVDHQFTVNVIATFSKSSDRDPEPVDLEIEGRSLIVDFGDVEPDWY